MSSLAARREIPIAITIVFGLFLLVKYFFNIPWMNDAAALIYKTGAVVSMVAVGLGPIAILVVHFHHIKKRVPGRWPQSISLVVAMMLMVVSGLLPPMGTNPVWKFLFDNAYQPLTSTIYALTGFFIVSATWRVFKARTVESTLLLIPAVLVIIGTTSLFTYYWAGWTTIRAWIMDVPNTAAWRGFGIGVAIGSIMLGCRVLLGIERGAGER